MIDKLEHSSCLNCPRRETTEWRSLDAADLDIVDRHKHDRILKPGQLLFNQGDPCEGIYCIKDGLVGERRVDAEGRSTLVRLCHPGTTVGYQDLLSKTDHRNSAEILRESYVCFIGKSIVRQLLSRSPSLGERFLHRSLQDARQLEDELVEAKTIGVRERFLHLLMIFYEKYGRQDAAIGHVLDIPVTRQDMAALIGTAPETVSRTISKIDADGLISFKGQRAVIPDLDMVFEEIAS
jgi:CRP/FNR family transcriptional regulator